MSEEPKKRSRAWRKWVGGLFVEYLLLIGPTALFLPEHLWAGA